jgi:hypothetical protein
MLNVLLPHVLVGADEPAHEWVWVAPHWPTSFNLGERPVEREELYSPLKYVGEDRMHVVERHMAAAH